MHSPFAKKKSVALNSNTLFDLNIIVTSLYLSSGYMPVL